MARAARGCAAGLGEAGDANVVAGRHIEWSETVDPSAVQEIPGVVSENSRPLFVVSRQTDVLSFAAAGCTEGEAALQLGIAVATVREHLARQGHV
jgi:DNA-binding NarL/FixJ family response regulator